MSINASRVTPAEFKRTIHSMTPEAGTKLSDIMAPAYYRHVASQFKSMDRIEVMPDDGAWYAELMVLYVSKMEVRVAKLSHVKLDTVKPEEVEDETHEVKWRGPSAKWGVVHKKTGDVVKDGFANKEEAAAYLSEHNKAMAA